MTARHTTSQLRYTMSLFDNTEEQRHRACVEALGALECWSARALARRQQMVCLSLSKAPCGAENVKAFDRRVENMLI